MPGGEIPIVGRLVDLKTRLCTITPSIGPIKSREEDGKVKSVGFLLKHDCPKWKLSLVKGDVFFPIQSYFKEKLSNLHCQFYCNKRPLTHSIKNEKHRENGF